MPRYVHGAVALIASLTVLGAPAHAATLIVVGGSLTGASDVNVNGTLYDVTFGDGSCVSLFSGCDDAATDFAFQTESDAQAAVAALFSQVFIDDTAGSGFDFDANPDLTSGCLDSGTCQIIIPFAVSGGNANTVQAQNFDTEPDGTFTQAISRTFDTATSVGGGAVFTYAQFTATAVIPVPAAVWLFGSGLLGLIGLSRHKKTV